MTTEKMGLEQRFGVPAPVAATCRLLTGPRLDLLHLTPEDQERLTRTLDG